MVKRILCDEVEDLSDTFFPSIRELVRLCHDLENSLLTKANLVRKAVLKNREKRLNEKAMRENSRPLTLVEKQKIEGILNALGGTVKTFQVSKIVNSADRFEIRCAFKST